YEPCVADAIKASFDVPFENPGRAPFLAVAPQSEKTVLQGIRTATFQPKTIGMVVGQGFRDGIQTQQVERLQSAIAHRRNPQGTLLAIAFGNVHPAERLRLVTVPTQGAESSRLGFRCVPEDSVHTGSLRTRITDNS